MKKLREVVLSINIDTTKEKAWDLLFNRFGEVNLFNPIIDGSHHTIGTQGEVGCERRCDIDAKNYVHEKITSRNGNESFEVEVIEGGLPMMDKMLGAFFLKEINPEKTEISFRMKFNTSPAFMGFFMKPMMSSMLNKMLVGLKYHLETGKEVTKGNIGAIMSSYKSLDLDRSFATTANLGVAA